jgi:hypothetical protein
MSNAREEWFLLAMGRGRVEWELTGRGKKRFLEMIKKSHKLLLFLPHTG